MNIYKINISKMISALIDDDLVESDFENARLTCDAIEREINKARKYMDEMDKMADNTEDRQSDNE